MIIKNVEESITDETLNRLREMLQTRRKKFEDGLKAYMKIQKCAESGGPINDDFKKNYTIFYEMNLRRPDEFFKKNYFFMLNKFLHDKPLPDNIKGVFIDTISGLHECGIRSNKATSHKATEENDREHTFEISFTSKLLHTVDPNLPIWDGIVAIKHFKMSPGKTTEEARWSKYEEYKDKFENYVSDEKRGQILIALFDEKYGEICKDASFAEKYKDVKITDVKKVDFILWLDRDEKSKK